MELTKEKAQEYINNFSERATKTLQAIGGHPMLLVYITPDGKLRGVDFTEVLDRCEIAYALGLPELANSLKDTLSRIAKEVLKKSGAVGCALICEVWYAKAKKDEVVVAYGDEPGKATFIGKPARERADRMEALSMEYEFKVGDGRKIAGMKTWVFHRDGDNNVSKVDPPEDKDNGTAEGRFVNLLE